MRYHGQRDHRCNGPDPIPVLVHIKLYSDSDPATAADNVRRFTVTDDLGGTYIRSIHISVTEAASGDIVLQAQNLTTAETSILIGPATIDAGDTSSYSASPGTYHEVKRSGTPQANYVSRGDVLQFDVTTGSDGLGLEVLVEFGPDIMRQ